MTDQQDCVTDTGCTQTAGDCRHGCRDAADELTRLRQEMDAPMPEPTPDEHCGLPHHTYTGSRCKEPAGRDGPHAAVLVVDGREINGAVAWDPEPAQHRITAAPHDPEVMRAAEERAAQCAEESERAAAWLTAQATPAPVPADTRACSGEEGFCDAHGYHRHAPVPADVREQIAEAMRTTPATGHSHKTGEEKWDHHPAPGERGHKYTYTCALCRADVDALADAVLRVPAIAAALEAVGEHAALKRAHVALAEQAGKDQAAIERFRTRIQSAADEARGSMRDWLVDALVDSADPREPSTAQTFREQATKAEADLETCRDRYAQQAEQALALVQEQQQRAAQLFEAVDALAEAWSRETASEPTQIAGRHLRSVLAALNPQEPS